MTDTRPTELVTDAMPTVRLPAVSIDAGMQLLPPVVLLASPGAGLTALLGVLVSELREGRIEHLRLHEADPGTLHYLLDRRVELDRGQWPASTGAVDPHRFAVEYDDGVLQLMLRFDVRHVPDQQVGDEYYDALVEQASAVFFLVDPETVPVGTRADARWAPCQGAADRLRQAVERRGRRGAGLRVGVILTKSDVYHGRPDDLQAVRRTVRRAFRPLQKAVRHFRVFLVSATGRYTLPVEIEGEKPPPGYPVQALNVGNPWSWHCHTFIQERLRKWKLASAFTACAIAGLVGFLFVRDHVDYHRVLAYVRAHSSPTYDQAILDRCREYLDAHAWGHYRRDVRTIVASVHRRREGRRWSQALADANAAGDDFPAARAALGAYTDAYPAGRYRSAAERAVEHAWLQEEKRDWTALLTGYRDLPLERFSRTVRAYLKKWPASDPHAAHRADVTLLWDTAQMKDEQAVWSEVTAHEQIHPEDVGGTLARYERYIQRVQQKLLPGRHATEARARAAGLRPRLAASQYRDLVSQGDAKRCPAERLAVYDAFLKVRPAHPLADAVRRLVREVHAQPAIDEWTRLDRFHMQHPEQFEQVADRMTAYADRRRDALRQTRWGRQQLHEIAQFHAWLARIRRDHSYRCVLVEGQAGAGTDDTDFFVLVYVAGRRVLSTESHRLAPGTVRPKWDHPFTVTWRVDVPIAVEVWEKDTWPDANDRVGKLVAVPHGPAPAGVAVLRDRVTMKALCGTHTLFWGRRDRPFRITFRSDFRDLDQWLSDHPFDEPPPGLSAPTTRTR